MKLLVALFVLAVLFVAGVAVLFARSRRRGASPTRPTLREPVLPPAPDDVYLTFADTEDLRTGDAFRDRINAIAVQSKLPGLGTADIDRLATIIDAREAKRQSFARTPPIALVRQARQDVDITQDGTSWFGGAPALGDIPWPRSLNGRPLHHLAQIDLSCLSADLVPPQMACTGHLCFFVGTSADAGRAHKVIHVPAGNHDPTPLPADLPLLYEGPHWGDHIVGHTPDNGPTAFPRWPISLFVLPSTSPDDTETARIAMDQAFGTDHPGTLTVQSYADVAPHLMRPWLWDSALRVVHSLSLAAEEIPTTIADARHRVMQSGARHAAELAFMTANETAFRRYVRAAEHWVAGRDPFAPMADDDIALLESMFIQIKTPLNRQPGFALFYRYTRGAMTSLSDALNATLLALVQDKPAVFALLPDQVQADIDRHHRLPASDRWHQMFGVGAETLGGTTDHAYDHLLLQLHSDQLMQWSWGHHRILQFWIGTAELAAGDWDAVVLRT